MNTTQSKPERVHFTYNRFRQQVAVVNINIRESNDGGYSYDQVPIPADKMSYAGIVDTLITFRYPSDKMQAIQNNLLADPSNPDAIAEFQEMHSWRIEAKSIAREIFPE